jgi:hypothetical protein
MTLQIFQIRQGSQRELTSVAESDRTTSDQLLPWRVQIHGKMTCLGLLPNPVFVAKGLGLTSRPSNIVLNEGVFVENVGRWESNTLGLGHRPRARAWTLPTTSWFHLLDTVLAQYYLNHDYLPIRFLEASRALWCVNNDQNCDSLIFGAGQYRQHESVSCLSAGASRVIGPLAFTIQQICKVPCY